MNLYKCTCVNSMGNNPITVYVVGSDESFARQAALKKLDKRGYCQKEVVNIQTIATSGNSAVFDVLALPSEQ